MVREREKERETDHADLFLIVPVPISLNLRPEKQKNGEQPKRELLSFTCGKTLRCKDVKFDQ